MNNSKYLYVISAVFVTSLIVSNIIAVKTGNFFGATLPVAVILFPVSYIIGDVLTEVYGYEVARKIILLGFACNALAVIAILLGQALPGASFWDAQEAYERILGFTPRLLMASFSAYLIGELSNAKIMAFVRELTAGRWLWMRTISSTLIGQGLDSLVFLSVAFWGTLPPAVLLTLIFNQWLFKVTYEVIATPLTYVVVNFLKRTESKTTESPLLAASD
jgi:uncharacterized integral membrane protein (TIGR00697 family)